ncbi:MAG TPA: MFS transporter [Azospirillum sp.]|nr:MFS transporter [Azospirillum sp.]
MIRESEAPPVPFALLLAEVTSVQTLATLSVLTLATVAPLAAASLGVGAEAVGYQVSLIYAAAALVSAFAGVVVRRWGAGTASVAAMTLGFVGCLGLTAGALWVAALASLLLGVGYGLVNPASSHLLNRFTPAARRNLVFSLKQTGVPLAGVLAGLLLPSIGQFAGWRAAAIAVAALFALTLAVFAPGRRRWDDDRSPGLRLRGSLLEGPQLVWRVRALRGYALMAFCFAALQLSLMTFTVTMLVHDLGWGIVAAGGAVAVVQAVGAAGRIVWGALADRLRSGTAVLAGIGALSAAAALTAAALTPGWPMEAVVAVLAVFGAASIGWNGVFLAEVARVAPPGAVGAATGGALMFTFAGVVVGPALFATVFDRLGSYGSTFALMAVFPLVGAIAVLRTGRGAGESDALRQNA